MTVQGADAAPVEIIAGSLGYLEKRGEQMHYAHYRAAGYPIGSGIVESAPRRRYMPRARV